MVGGGADLADGGEEVGVGFHVGDGPADVPLCRLLVAHGECLDLLLGGGVGGASLSALLGGDNNAVGGVPQVEERHGHGHTPVCRESHQRVADGVVGLVVAVVDECGGEGGPYAVGELHVFGLGDVLAEAHEHGEVAADVYQAVKLLHGVDDALLPLGVVGALGKEG